MKLGLVVKHPQRGKMEKLTKEQQKELDEQRMEQERQKLAMQLTIDQGAADKKLLAALKREKELMTAFEATKAYDKLQADLEKYKDKLD